MVVYATKYWSNFIYVSTEHQLMDIKAVYFPDLLLLNCCHFYVITPAVGYSLGQLS